MDHEGSPETEHETDAAGRAPWARLHLWQMQPVRDVLLGLGILSLFWLGQATSVVTVPLLLALLLAYLFEPVIVWSMGRFGLRRRTSVVAIIAGVVIFVVIPSVVGASYGSAQIVLFGQGILDNFDQVQRAQQIRDIDEAHKFLEDNGVGGAWVTIHDSIRKADDDESTIGLLLLEINEWVRENRDQVAQTAANFTLETIQRVLRFFGALFGIVFMGFLTGFFFFFVSTEWIQLKGFGTKLLPENQKDRILDLLGKFDAVISGFIRGRITIAFIQAFIFSIGYYLIGVPGAFILGPVVAVLAIVPYLALVGLPISVSLIWLEGHTGFMGAWWWVLGAPTALYFFGQALDDYIWTPLIQGKSTGMDTPTIVFASIAGGALFGVFGLLIAIPIAACVKIFIQEIFWPKFCAWAKGDAPDPLPIED